MQSFAAAKLLCGKVCGKCAEKGFRVTKREGSVPKTGGLRPPVTGVLQRVARELGASGFHHSSRRTTVKAVR
jgi:hypothetical protein